MNARYSLLIFHFLFLLIISIQLVAQDFTENNFTLYTRQEGLSNNVVTGIMQDSTGYVWIATYAGLNRFNGSRFVQFHSNSDSMSLPAEQLEGLAWLDNYRLAAYAGGLHIIDTHTGEAHNLFIPYDSKQYQYKFNWIMAVKSDAAGDIFLLTRSGFYQYDNNYRLVFRFDYYPKEDLTIAPFVFGRELFWVDQRQLAITSSNGIYIYNTLKHQFKKMKPGDSPLMDEFLDYRTTPYTFFQPRPGNLIVIKTAKDSIVYLDLSVNKRTASRLPDQIKGVEFDYRSELISSSDTTLYITSNISGFYKMKLNTLSGEIKILSEKYFPYYYCRHLMQDHDKNLWIATNKGLFHQDNNRLHIKQATIPGSLEGRFPNFVIQDLYADTENLYVAAAGKGGLLIFDKKQLRFKRRINFEKYKWGAGSIYTITSTGGNNLLVGTNGPLFRVNTRTYKITEIKPDKWVRASSWTSDIYKDKKENIWIAADHFYKYDAITHQFSIISTDNNCFNKIERAQRISEDSSGNIWLAGHGLLRYNTTVSKFDLLVDSFPFIKIPDRQVNTFIVDRQNNLWLNSNNNGLIFYNTSKKTFLHFTKEDGLPDNNIASMVIISDKLWMATFSGIACLDLKTFRITSFGKEDGFPDVPISIGAKFFYDSKENNLLIGFTNTIVQFDPNIIFEKRRAPHLFIESLTGGDQKKYILPGKNISVCWRHAEVTVSIGSINYFSGSGQRFAYRLVKEDSSSWQQLGEQNTFSISNLSPGYQRIQVKLFSVNNRWPQQELEFGITITTPFWRKAWFIILAAGLIFTGAFLLFRWLTGNVRKKEQAKTHIQQLKAEEYKNQFELEQISNYFSSSMAGKKNIEDVLWGVTKNLMGQMNYEDCMIYMWNEDNSRMIQKASHGPKGHPDAIGKKAFDVLPGQGVVGYVMQTKEPLIIPDTRKDSRYRVDDIRRLSELCVPIIHNNELIGIIDSEHPLENHFTERDIKILTTIATLVGNKIMQIKSEELLEIKQKEIGFINQQLAEAQLSALQTQMNPHFIFNSLNSIKGMILDNEQQKASRYLSKFANMIRITLNQSKEIFTTLYENIEHLESYLVMEKLRFDDSFTFNCIVDDNIDMEDTLIPTLMLQPLAENAIWHGLMPNKGEKKLTIRFYRLAEIIFCSIEDNGIGINQSEQLKKLNKAPHQSMGLSNLRNRIKILNEKYKMGCTLEINDLKDIDKEQTGTRAVLRFMIITNKPFL